jgi:AMP phosphorylase
MPELNAKIIKIKTGEKSVILNETDAGEMMLHIHDRVSLKKDLQKIVAIVDVSDSMVERGEIGIYEDFLPFFAVSDGDAIELSVATPPPSVAFIRKKMKGGTLNKEELHRIVKDTVTHSLSELEVAAFLMAEQYVGMNMDEVEHLTRAIVETVGQ